MTGYVVGISTLWSDDFSVWLSADGEDSRVWEVEHVINVLVEVGDFVEAGQSGVGISTGMACGVGGAIGWSIINISKLNK